MAQENNAAALRKASGAKELPIGDAAAKGPGATRGESVSEELIAGNARYLEAKRGMPPSTAMRAIGPLATPAATVVCLTPLPEPAHVLLGCAEEALFVVPCTATGVDELTIGNAEYGAVALAAKALWIVGAPSEALTLAVSGAKAHARRKAASAPLRSAARAAGARTCWTPTIGVSSCGANTTPRCITLVRP